LLELIRNPGELARLQQNPGLTGTAVEEMIRCVTPVKEFMRTAQADTEVRGVKIAKGESVLLSYVSANRDEDKFDNPWMFDVTRTPNNHVGFGGGGVHFCLGANLARREIAVVFEELHNRIPDITVTAEPAMLLSAFIHGIKRLPVSWTPQ
jgi:cytochrome P450